MFWGSVIPAGQLECEDCLYLGQTWRERGLWRLPRVPVLRGKLSLCFLYCAAAGYSHRHSSLQNTVLPMAWWYNSCKAPLCIVWHPNSWWAAAQCHCDLMRLAATALWHGHWLGVHMWGPSLEWGRCRARRTFLEGPSREVSFSCLYSWTRAAAAAVFALRAVQGQLESGHLPRARHTRVCGMMRHVTPGVPSMQHSM